MPRPGFPRNHQDAEPPGMVKATDLFPELSVDIDRRISHSETRLKLWIVGAVLANALAIAGATIPSVYYLGRLSDRMEASMLATRVTQERLDSRRMWMRDSERWEDHVETFLGGKFKPPPRLSVDEVDGPVHSGK